MISPGSIPADALGSFKPRTCFGFSAAADVHEIRTDEDDPMRKVEEQQETRMGVAALDNCGLK
jgi:hypothetical protein